MRCTKENETKMSRRTKTGRLIGGMLTAIAAASLTGAATDSAGSIRNSEKLAVPGPARAAAALMAMRALGCLTSRETGCCAGQQPAPVTAKPPHPNGWDHKSQNRWGRSGKGQEERNHHSDGPGCQRSGHGRPGSARPPVRRGSHLDGRRSRPAATAAGNTPGFRTYRTEREASNTRGKDTKHKKALEAGAGTPQTGFPAGPARQTGETGILPGILPGSIPGRAVRPTIQGGPGSIHQRHHPPVGEPGNNSRSGRIPGGTRGIPGLRGPGLHRGPGAHCPAGADLGTAGRHPSPGAKPAPAAAANAAFAAAITAPAGRPGNRGTGTRRSPFPALEPGRIERPGSPGRSPGPGIPGNPEPHGRRGPGRNQRPVLHEPGHRHPVHRQLQHGSDPRHNGR